MIVGGFPFVKGNFFVVGIKWKPTTTCQEAWQLRLKYSLHPIWAMNNCPGTVYSQIYHSVQLMPETQIISTIHTASACRPITWNTLTGFLSVPLIFKESRVPELKHV